MYTVGEGPVDVHGALFAGHGGGDGQGDLRGPEIQAVRPSGDAQDELRGSEDGASARRGAASEPVEEVVDVRQGGDRLHPPLERAEDQELHPLDRLRLEHVPRVPGLQVQGRRDVGLLHLGGQGQARHGQQLCHPSLAFRKLVEREEAVQVVDGQAGSERAETVARVNLPNPVDGVRPDAEIHPPAAQPLGVVLPRHVRCLRLQETGDAFLGRHGELRAAAGLPAPRQ
uniref:Uncharacterized protein n=1 Tax=Zea mays TaxID=4577 RepID=C4J274_MAIZE|nr:unknown [Zea mays]